MALQFFKDPISNDNIAVSSENPLPGYQVELPDHYQPPVAGQTIVRLVQVPGIGTGAAYAAGDAFGTLITFPDVFRIEKGSGLVMGVFLLDLDDEGLGKDVPLYIQPITATTDNSAIAVSAADILLCRWAFQITTFVDLGSRQIGMSTGQPMHIVAGGVNLYTQLRTLGADNITAGNIPLIGIVVVPD